MNTCKDCIWLDDEGFKRYCDFYEKNIEEVAPKNGDECAEYTYYNGDDDENIFTD